MLVENTFQVPFGLKVIRLVNISRGNIAKQSLTLLYLWKHGAGKKWVSWNTWH